jgi:hypothetical protein
MERRGDFQRILPAPQSLRKFYDQCKLKKLKGRLHQIGIGYKWLKINWQIGIQIVFVCFVIYDE